jgi:hypothetical protein
MCRISPGEKLACIVFSRGETRMCRISPGEKLALYIYYICIHYLDHDLTYFVTPSSVFRITPLSKLYVP